MIEKTLCRECVPHFYPRFFYFRLNPRERILCDVRELELNKKGKISLSQMGNKKEKTSFSFKLLGFEILFKSARDRLKWGFFVIRIRFLNDFEPKRAFVKREG